jgi:polyphosphate kinase 2 (PPK2 family)
VQAYEACLSATSTAAAPWHVVPADGFATHLTKPASREAIVEAIASIMAMDR